MTMKVIWGLKLGGLQQKIFNLMFIIIVVLLGAYAAVAYYQHKNLASVVGEASVEQQDSIKAVSEQTMEGVLNSTMTQTTALQAYIANDVFADVQGNVQILQAYTENLFEHAGRFEDRKVPAPTAVNDGQLSVQLIHEDGVDPEDSETLGLVANMSETMKAIYQSSDMISSVFVGLPDGNMILVNDRSGTFVAEDGSPLNLDIRHRPWYVQAVEEGEMIFTGVEIDAYTNIPMLECAAPVYYNDELVAVVAADIWLTSISDYVDNKSNDGSFLCVVNDKGQMLFSPKDEGIFRAATASDAPDLRLSSDQAFADFVTLALSENTGLKMMEIEGTEYYICGVPLETLGWTVITAVEKELIYQPTAAMLASYDAINNRATGSYTSGLQHSAQTVIVLTVVIVLLAVTAAMILAYNVVKPIEYMTQKINSLNDKDKVFKMEKVYRTGDEIEVLAQSFASLSEKTQDYISQIMKITAEKERIGTELALATRIQADMLPNIYPAFPDRPEFDIYASMDPAKEVGGDFYDFFLADDDHLCMVMADVSGKGVPAALFMMASKIILQNNAMMGKSPAQILKDTNAAICANNREDMFVTVWMGIMEISTGKLTASNAGHEYPILKRADGDFELVKDKHCFVLGGMEGLNYKEYEIMLTPGDKLFLYTDGVPEATNPKNELFGTERMLEALNHEPDSEPEKILKVMRTCVDSFAEESEQFDDITMLCMEYRGPSEDQKRSEDKKPE